MSESKSELRDALLYKQKNGYDIITAQERELCDAYCADYAAFLDAARTEREAARESVRLAQAAGFKPFNPGMPLKAGDRIYFCNRDKALMLAVIGTEPLEKGIALAAAHIDSPRLDLKQLPLYEDAELCYFKTHYYGGVKKYQWVTIPLELHGVVCKKDGTAVEVVIGSEPGDPQLVITDLLPHLGAEQMKKNASEFIPAENLNLLIGSVPAAEEGSDRVKLAIAEILNEKYGITEEDFLSAELEAVPAFPTRDIGLDRSLIGGYGHDDRVCAYAELRAILDCAAPKRTAVCILADKEEVGSMGVTGMLSQSLERFVEELCEILGAKLRRVFANSICVSADVCNAFDPNFAEVSDKRNNAKLNYGVGILKYTGARGKSGSSDASAELVAEIRRIFSDAGVLWQMGELGKVDQGGGGTVALDLANRDIDTIDAGVPVLSMHSPFEVVAKLDCWMTYRGVKAIYEDK